MGWTIKQMSKITGLPTDSLRYYDKLGIVSPKRKDNEYRYYDERDYLLLKYIIVMKYAHFSLGEIKTIINSMSLKPSDECNRFDRELITAKRTELIECIKNYKQILKFIDTVLPMMENVDVFTENEVNLDNFVSKIYDNIMKPGVSL